MAPLYCSQGHENIEDSRFCRQCGEQLNAAAMALFQGGILGKTLAARYRVVRELGHGGFGRTYLAEDTNRFHEPCVLKEFAPQVQGEQALQKAEELFEREAGILYKLQHPQIPRFRELFRAEVQGRGRLFLVQDYVEGQTYQAILRSRWLQGQCFSEAEVTQLLSQLLPVLAYIHDRGVIHRDIAPDNLILRSTDGLPILIDFGGVKQIAAAVASQVYAGVPTPSLGVTLLGKIGYAPQEQMSTGDVFPHSDLYALGATVLVLLTGKDPQLLLAGNPPPWQLQIALNPRLASVLERMLHPNSARRFQSAREVLQALHQGTPAPDYGITRPPVEHQPPVANYPAYPATIAISPRAKTAVNQVPEVSLVANRSAPANRSRRGGWGCLFSLALLSLLLGGGWWAGQRWLLPLLPLPTPSPSSKAQTSPNAQTNKPPEPEFSKAEQARKQAIDTRRRELGIDNAFLVTLVNQAFHAKHPELAGRQLSKGKDDDALRENWDATVMELLDRLQTISPEGRSQMGRYTDADLKDRQAAVNQLSLSSRALNDLTDAQFFYLFPQQSGENLLKQPFGQVWQAIASDQLKTLKDGTSLQPIQFPEGRFSQQVSNTLNPGQGRAYLAKLTKDQAIRLKLRSASSAIKLSLYPPTSKSAALLEDSTATEWSGKLQESGLYEIVIVATGAEPIRYELDLAAADEVTSEASQ